MHKGQEKKLAIVCFIAAAIMFYATVKACLRMLHYFG